MLLSISTAKGAGTVRMGPYSTAVVLQVRHFHTSAVRTGCSQILEKKRPECNVQLYVQYSLLTSPTLYLVTFSLSSHIVSSPILLLQFLKTDFSAILFLPF